MDKYTANFGGILTEFVIQNEQDFQKLNESQLSNISQKRSYESVIKLASKNIGFESMKIIEQLQSWKSPSAADLGRMKGKVKQNFAVIKEGLGLKLIQITEERAELK